MNAPAPLPAPLEFLQDLWHVNHALERLSSQMEKAIGVTAQQRLVIRCVGVTPGLLASQLASQLHLDRGTITATVKRLEAKKLVSRRSDPSDKRLTRLWLTPRGKALEQPRKGTVEHAVKRMIDHERPANMRTTQKMLSKLAFRLLEEIDALM